MTSSLPLPLCQLLIYCRVEPSIGCGRPFFLQPTWSPWELEVELIELLQTVDLWSLDPSLVLQALISQNTRKAACHWAKQTPVQVSMSSMTGSLRKD